MKQIYNHDAYNEGVQKADEIRKTIDALLAKQPAGYEFAAVGQELRIYAPYKITPSTGYWNWKRDGDKEYSYINVAALTAGELDAQLNRISQSIADKERALGYEDQMKALFPAPEPATAGPAQPAPEPKIAEPKLSGQELRIRETESDIAKAISTIELLKGMDLPIQMALHENELNHLRKVLEIVKKGYTEISWDDDKYTSHALKEYKSTVHPLVLKSLKEAQDAGVFDSFGIWEESDDPILIGRVTTDQLNTRFKIDDW